VMKQHFF